MKELSLHTVHSVVECERIMEQGWKNRSVGYTLMNKDSSRSHSIFTIHLEISTVGKEPGGLNYYSTLSFNDCFVTAYAKQINTVKPAFNSCLSY